MKKHRERRVLGEGIIGNDNIQSWVSEAEDILTDELSGGIYVTEKMYQAIKRKAFKWHNTPAGELNETDVIVAYLNSDGFVKEFSMEKYNKARRMRSFPRLIEVGEEFLTEEEIHACAEIVIYNEIRTAEFLTSLLLEGE